MKQISESINNIVSNKNNSESPLLKNKEAINKVHKNLSIEVENLKKGLNDLKATIEENKELKSKLYPNNNIGEEVNDEEKLVIPSPKITSYKAVIV